MHFEELGSRSTAGTIRRVRCLFPFSYCHTYVHPITIHPSCPLLSIPAKITDALRVLSCGFRITVAALIFLVLDYIWLMPNEFKFVWLYVHSAFCDTSCSFQCQCKCALISNITNRSPPYRLCEALYILSRYLPIAVQT